MKTYLTMENTVGFNEEQLAALNKWIEIRLENIDEDDENYHELEQAAGERALNFYQEILGDAGVDYDE